MKERELNRLKQLTALRLLGLSNDLIGKLAGDAGITVSRYTDRLCTQLGQQHNLPERDVKNHLWAGKQQLKTINFKPQQSTEAITKTLNKLISTDSYRYLCFVWFGRITPGKHADKKTSYLQPHERLFVPYNKGFGFGTEEKLDKLLSNLPTALQLIGWSNNEISELNSALSADLEQGPNLEHIEETFDLLKVAPRLPAKTKQKEKRRLIQFAVRHLERDSQNFVYTTRFPRKATPQVFKDGKFEPLTSWWAYGPKDILDWYDWFD